MIQSPRNSPLFGAIKAAAAAVASGGAGGGAAGSRSPARPPPPPSPVDSLPESFCLDGDDYSVSGDSATSDAAEPPVNEVVEDLKKQMLALNEAASSMGRQVRTLYERAEQAEAVSAAVAAAVAAAPTLKSSLKPKTKKVAAWLEAHGVSAAEPTLDAFFDACLAAATTADFETRVLTFSKEDAVALFEGEQRLSVYDLLSRLPELFE